MTPDPVSPVQDGQADPFLASMFAYLQASVEEYIAARAELAACHAAMAKAEKILRLERDILACEGIAVDLPVFYRQPSQRQLREQKAALVRAEGSPV